MTLVVNLFGGPGCGKSTTSAGLFHDMKKKSLNVELVTEYAKELVWSDSISAMSDQLYLLANQNRRLDRLVGKVDYVITDAPLLLSAYYGVKYGRHPEIVRRASHDIFNTYNNLNVMIKRTKQFNPIGRLGKEESAKEADVELRKLVPLFTELEDDEDIVPNILNLIRARTGDDL